MGVTGLFLFPWFGQEGTLSFETPDRRAKSTAHKIGRDGTDSAQTKTLEELRKVP